MRMKSILFAALLLAACRPPTADDPEKGAANSAVPAATPLRPASTAPVVAAGAWNAEGAALAYRPDDADPPEMLISCGGGRLTVSLPGVRRIGSEERLSFGGGGEILTLVVEQGPGTTPVRASGPAPDTAVLQGMLEAGPGANYGATSLGPVSPVPDALARSFVDRCRP